MARRPHPDDVRAVSLQLTPDGEVALAAMSVDLKRIDHSIATALHPDEVVHLYALLAARHGRLKQTYVAKWSTKRSEGRLR